MDDKYIYLGMLHIEKHREKKVSYMTKLRSTLSQKKQRKQEKNSVSVAPY